MKQLIQFVGTGETCVCEVPTPQLANGAVLVRTAASVVSVGTERMLVDFAGKNLFQKAASRPDLVMDVVAKARREGIASAFSAVHSRLEHPMPLGYSSAGEVIGVGAGVTELGVGDRVACAGAGHAVHAEVASVPRMLVARVPDDTRTPISFEEAAFTTIGSIALHAIRLAEVRMGELVAVLGLGLLGQIAVQLLTAAGCRVIGMDPNSSRCEVAQDCGAMATASSASEMESLSAQLSKGRGIDAVLITADTSSNEPITLAGDIARDRAAVVVIGAVGLSVPRKRYYEKELQLRVSRSYGPGRYDSTYEERGADYPIGFVRWTENRNMEAILDLLGAGKLNLKALITHRFAIQHANAAYELLLGKRSEPFLGVVISYPEGPAQLSRVSSHYSFARYGAPTQQSVSIGLLGAGAFARGTLLPAMTQNTTTRLVAVCAGTGLTTQAVGQRFRFQYCTTNESDLFQDSSINTIVIATRHQLHAARIIAALQHGKHVFCEKPLCLSEHELTEIISAWGEAHKGSDEAPHLPPVLMVGYNRRFAPMVQKLCELFSFRREPLMITYRINAGYIGPDHWIQDSTQGGGRILGEVCHFVDLMSFLTGAAPLTVQAWNHALPGHYTRDNMAATIEFGDGSIGNIVYASSGDTSLCKERLEVFGGNAVGIIDDFRRMEFACKGQRTSLRSRFRQDKGHRNEWDASVEGILSGRSPIPFEQLVSTTLCTLAMVSSMKSRQLVRIDTPRFISLALARESAFASSTA